MLAFVWVMVRKDVFLSWAFSYGQIIFTNGPLMYMWFNMFFWLKVAHLGSYIAKTSSNFWISYLRRKLGNTRKLWKYSFWDDLFPPSCPHLLQINRFSEISTDGLLQKVVQKPSQAWNSLLRVYNVSKLLVNG